jgi:hypothetical protein
MFSQESTSIALLFKAGILTRKILSALAAFLPKENLLLHFIF